MSTKKIAVIAAHPDDEILGCGGTIARHIAAGDEVHVLIMAEGETSRLHARNRENVSEKLDALGEAARRAHAILGTSSLKMLPLPDNRLDSLDLLDVIKYVEDFVEYFSPEIVYTHFPNDLNIDHRVVSEAVQTACRPIPNACVKTILFFEVASSTEWKMAEMAVFTPNYFVDISNFLDKKLAALHCYQSEMRDFPHARSLLALESLARWRGATVGHFAAEAFMLGRSVL